jgi:hypothetical protein
MKAITNFLIMFAIKGILISTSYNELKFLKFAIKSGTRTYYFHL